jgi:transposase InsO family protein
LKLIHTYICGPFHTVIRNGHTYFISFIDDYTRYGYVFLIKEKVQALYRFKSFKVGVELQLNKRIKKVKSDRGDEYYGRYDGLGEQCPVPFAKFLEENGIVLHYIMPGSPIMNGVAERHNRALMKMVCSLLSHTTLPLSLWGEALRAAAYILNRVSTKAANKTLYELWTGHKPYLQYFRVWGSSAEARSYRPNEKNWTKKLLVVIFLGMQKGHGGISFMIPLIKLFSRQIQLSS